jgi:hypothetical protein
MEIADDARIDSSKSRLELAKEMYTACDDTRADEYAGYFRDDARFRWANLDPVEGNDGIASFVAGFFEDIETLDHTFTGIYEADVADEQDDIVATLVLEAVVTYTLLDGSEAVVPATTTLDLDGSDAVVEARVYVDTSPVYEE